MDRDRIVAIGLLTQRDIDMLGQGFRRAYPVETVPCFDELLRQIDDADALHARVQAQHGRLS